MRTILILIATPALLVVLGGSAMADTTVEAQLEAQNSSGAGGTATLTGSSDGELTVVIRARGLVPGQPHAQHIHGSLGGSHFQCPTLDSDSDGDGILTNEEATGEYGTIFLSLTTSGDASANSGLATDRMPVADSSGRLEYRRTFSAQDVPDGLLKDLSQVHIVQHGIDVNDNDRYDLAGLGVSTFAKNLGLAGVPEEATNPATCGVVTGAGAHTPPKGGIETGGGSDDVANASLAALGALLLAFSAAVLLARRHMRLAKVDDDS